MELQKFKADKYLTENPRITHFRGINRRHTPFIAIDAEFPLSTGKCYADENDNDKVIYRVPLTPCAGSLTDAHGIVCLGPISVVFDNPRFCVKEGIIHIAIVDTTGKTSEETPDVVFDSVTGQELLQEDIFNQRRARIIYSGVSLGVKPAHSLDIDCNRSRVLHTRTQTIVRPWFWFNLNSATLPLVAARYSNIYVEVVVRKSVTLDCNFVVRAHGYQLGDEEIRLFIQNTDPVLCQVRQPPLDLIELVPIANPTKWTRYNHHMFGAAFNRRLLTLFACIKHYSVGLDVHVRQLIARYLAFSDAMSHKFDVNLTAQNWANATPMIYFVVSDENGVPIENSDGGIIRACITVTLPDGERYEYLIDGSELHYSHIIPDFVFPVWCFGACHPLDTQINGHINFSNHHLEGATYTLSVTCDARVHRLQVFGWCYISILIKDGFIIRRECHQSD